METNDKKVEVKEEVVEEVDEKEEEGEEKEEDKDEGEDESMKFQRNKWKQKAVDPVTGKTYKELFEEAKATAPKADDKAPKVKFDMPQTDLYALIKADVPEEDVSEVVEYAKFKKIPVADALKSNFIRTLLSDRKEERRTAEATSTGAARRGSKAVTGDVLLAKAEKGEMPDSDEDLDKLLDARLESKRKAGK